MKPGPKRGTKRIPGSGRQKGTPNKVTGDMKAEAWRVFNELQKDKKTSLLKLAGDKPEWFYTVFGCRLLPKVVEGEIEGKGVLEIRIRDMRKITRQKED